MNTPLRMEMRADSRYLINVGSLGEPKSNRHPRYVLFEEQAVTWRGLGAETA